MNKKLKELRNIMIADELRDVKFEHKNKEYVFKNINSNQNKHRRAVNYWIPRGLSLVMISGFVFALFVFSNDYILKPNSSPISHSSSETSDKEGIKNEDSEVLTKEEIQQLMLNSVHNFKTAKGSFTAETEFHKETVEYQVSLRKNEIGYYIKTNLLDRNQDPNDTSKKESGINAVFNGDKILELHNDSKKYKLSSITLDEVYKTHPFAGSAARSIYPNEMATLYLKDHEKWEVEKQSSTFLDKNIIIIKGSFDKANTAKFNASSFRLWVDKQTGILLKQEVYNKDNEVVESLVTKELEINQSIDNNKFSISIPKDFSQIEIDR